MLNKLLKQFLQILKLFTFSYESLLNFLHDLQINKNFDLTSDVPDSQFQVRPDPDPDFFFKLESGRNRIRIFFSN